MINFTHPEFKTFLKDSLNAGSVSVTFTKVDGTKRVMLCTRNPGKITAQYTKENKTDSVITESETAIRVFDLEKSAWRSFKWASIIEFCIEED